MKKVIILAAIIDLDDPDDNQEQPPVPVHKPYSPDTLLRRLLSEVHKGRNPHLWLTDGTLFKE
jgi:hypothetical protein